MELEVLSRFVSKSLDNMGYSSEMVAFRRFYWPEMDKIVNLREANAANLTVMTAGSKAEGVTSLYESDIDLMYTLNDVLVVDAAATGYRFDRKSVFLCDRSQTSPGYTRLKFCILNGTNVREIMIDSLVMDRHRSVYLSSDSYVKGCQHIFNAEMESRNNGMRLTQISGPSIPGTGRYISTDTVFAFPAYIQETGVLQTFVNRYRRNNWPTQDLIHEISNSMCQVVAVGNKDSEAQFLEWRFCFVDSEAKLLHSLNETQRKVFILLKMVIKSVLQNVTKEITSYIAKNITFWMAEFLRPEEFQEDHLIKLLMNSLAFLKKCFSDWRFIPYFMIPGRNLLTRKILPFERRQLVESITDLLTEGPVFLLKCERLCRGMTAMCLYPDQFSVYAKKRDLLEKVKLIHLIFESATMWPYNYDDIFNLLIDKACDLVLPNWRDLEAAGVDYLKIVNDKTHEILS